LNKINFGEKGTQQGLKPWSYVFSLKMRNQGYIVLYKTIWKTFKLLEREPDKDLPCSYVSPFTMENQRSRSSW